MASKTGLSDSQADVIAAVTVILTLVACCIFWVATT